MTLKQTHGPAAQAISGSLDGIALKPLTVDFHEVGFGATLNGENGQPFWFQLSDDEKQKAGSPWGPANPQALNRYSYVLNGPVRWTDPSGHKRVEAGYADNGVSYTYGYQEVRGPDGKAVKNKQGSIIYEIWSCELGAGARCTVMWVPDGPQFRDYKAAVDRLAEVNDNAPNGAVIIIGGAAVIAGCITPSPYQVACAIAVGTGVWTATDPISKWKKQQLQAASNAARAFGVIGYGDRDNEPTAIYKCYLDRKCRPGNYGS